MQLLSCKKCERQYDVTRVSRREFPCSCGATVHNVELKAIDAKIIRCGSCGATVTPEAETCEFCRSSIERDAGALSSICPECYARNPENSQFCVTCGIRFDVNPFSVEEKATECPACSRALAGRGIGEIPIHECPGCNGLWVPGDRFNELINRVVQSQKATAGSILGFSVQDSPRKPAFSTRVVYRRCPQCQGIMQRKNFARRSGVIVDVCGKHGVWLDADELEAVADFVSRGGLENASLVAEEFDADGFIPVDEKVIEGRIEAERIMARERGAAARRKSRLHDGPSGNVLGTLGELFRHLLES